MDNKTLKNKTLLVILITLITMFLEIGYGIISKSMALTADGFHMATHILALSITFAVCHIITKCQAHEEKINALGGYTSAIFLGITSLYIIYESIERILAPQSISFNEAILVSVIGLIANIICILIMNNPHNHIHHSCHKHNYTHKENLNFKAAYLHILADVLTSLTAIIALLFGKYFGFIFLDSIIGVIGGLIILRWAINLTKDSFKILIH